MAITPKEPCPRCGGVMERRDSYGGSEYDVCWACRIKMKLIRGSISEM